MGGAGDRRRVGDRDSRRWRIAASGKKTIAREVGVAVNTVRRYLRQPIEAGQQVRPAARRLTDERRAGGPDAVRGAGGRQCGRRPAAAGRAGLRDQRADDRAGGGRHPSRAPGRAAGDGAGGNGTGRPAADRFRPEAAADCRRARPDLLLVAVLSYSRRLFVKAFLNERGADWREGIAARAHAFRRRPAHAARGQCPAVGARARPRDGHGDLPSGLSRVLSRLGRAAARVRAVSRADEGQDRSGREIRQTQRRSPTRPSTRSPRSSSTWRRGWRSPTSGATGRRMKRRWSGSSATSA